MEKLLITRNSSEENVILALQQWGYCLSYAITQSTERSDKDVAAALMAFRASTFKDFAIDGRRMLARRITEQSMRSAFRGHSTDMFFKMEAKARAIVVLKIKAKFNLQEIAEIFKITPAQVEEILENSRLTFSNGKPWIKTPTRRLKLVDESLAASAATACPDAENGRLYERYMEHDLESNQILTLHRHIVNCGVCKENLIHFKSLYNDWLFVIPDPEVNKNQLGLFKKTYRLSKTIRPKDRIQEGPSFLSSLKKFVTEKETQILLLSFALFMLVLQLFRG